MHVIQHDDAPDHNTNLVFGNLQAMSLRDWIGLVNWPVYSSDKIPLEFSYVSHEK